MSRIAEQIATQVAQIRSHAEKWNLPEKREPLVIVPFVSKRCMVACGPGRCNCWPTVGHHFCLVFESHLKSCGSDFQSEMAYLQSKVNDHEASCVFSEQDDILDEHHVALQMLRS